MSYQDWAHCRNTLVKGVGRLGKLRPNTAAAMDLLSKPEEDDVLDAKTRELISLAVATTTRCDGCITAHTTAAIQAGATREEVAEALSVAIDLNAGPALVYATRVLDAYDDLEGQTPHGH
jgi:AhpD family alkylhydroperoxidase